MMFVRLKFHCYYVNVKLFVCIFFLFVSNRFTVVLRLKLKRNRTFFSHIYEQIVCQVEYAFNKSLSQTNELCVSVFACEKRVCVRIHIRLPVREFCTENFVKYSKEKWKAVAATLAAAAAVVAALLRPNAIIFIHIYLHSVSCARTKTSHLMWHFFRIWYHFSNKIKSHLMHTNQIYVWYTILVKNNNVRFSFGGSTYFYYLTKLTWMLNASLIWNWKEQKCGLYLVRYRLSVVVSFSILTWLLSHISIRNGVHVAIKTQKNK